MKKTAAFFDIDGTIYREGFITEIFKKMIKYDLINPSKWDYEVKPAFLSWDKRQGDYDTYLLKMVDVYKEALEGIESFHMRYVARKVIEEKGERVYTYSRERIRWHKKQNHKVIAISGSPLELVKEMSQKYEMDDYKGTLYKVGTDGYYTGEVVPMWDAESKQKALFEMVHKYNVDLEASYAYGDTSGDYTMLKMVGHPFAINPTRELLNLIQKDIELQNKITVIVERKDAIYKLNIDCLNLL